MLKLTEYGTGMSIRVRPDAIKSMRRLSVAVHVMDGGVPQELGGRTRIDTSSDMFLVVESIEEIEAMIDA